MKSLKNVLICIHLGFAMTEPLICQTQDSLAISQEEIGARLRFLSSDLLMGRYPGTQGEQLTIAYLISELESFGVSPGVNKSWLQPVKIVRHMESSQIHPEARLSGRFTRLLKHGQDIRFSNYTDRPHIETGGELIFAGFGINASMYGWNDFEGCDLKGKIVVALLGEPSIPDDSTMFNGFRASRFSWEADKISEMERRGAIGVLWVQPAGSLTIGPANGVIRLAEEAAKSKLLFTGSITDSTLANLLPPDSPKFSNLIKNASHPRFHALPLGVRLDVLFQTIPSVIISNNVVGIVKGTDSLLRSEQIVISSHWDAYGITSPVNGDSICNGALDDGSGLTIELALARVFAKNPQPRSITFLFATAEEWGLLGAESFIKNGPFLPDQIIANFNLDDGFELFGRKRDVAPLGIELSTLGNVVEEIALRKELHVSPDPFPQEGFFLRADNYPLARVGVPALYLALGTEDENHPAGWTIAKSNEYMEKHYHSPSDDYQTVVFDLTGSLQLAQFTRELIIAVAKAKERPLWVNGGEFSRRTDLLPLNK